MKISSAAGLLILSVLLVSAFSVSVATPVRAVPSILTVDISSAISGSAQWITPDTPQNIAWISVGISHTGNLYKVNLGTVIAQGASAVTGYTNILGAACGSGLVYGPGASVVLKGNLYATSWYSNNCIGVSQIRESDGVVLNTWTYTTGAAPSDARAIVSDGTYLYVGVQFGILKLTTSGTFSVVHSVTSDVTGLAISASTLSFSESGSHGGGQVNTDGSGFSEYACSCLGGTFVATQGGSVWITDNRDHTLLKFTAGTLTATYATGMTSDGPYGLTYDSTNNGFWLAGYANNEDRFFSIGTSSIDASKDIATSKQPFNGFTDGTSNVWQLALGSTDLIEIPATTSVSSGGGSVVTSPYTISVKDASTGNPLPSSRLTFYLNGKTVITYSPSAPSASVTIPNGWGSGNSYKVVASANGYANSTLPTFPLSGYSTYTISLTPSLGSSQNANPLLVNLWNKTAPPSHTSIQLAIWTHYNGTNTCSSEFKNGSLIFHQSCPLVYSWNQVGLTNGMWCDKKCSLQLLTYTGSQIVFNIPTGCVRTTCQVGVSVDYLLTVRNYLTGAQPAGVSVESMPFNDQIQWSAG